MWKVIEKAIFALFAPDLTGDDIVRSSKDTFEQLRRILRDKIDFSKVDEVTVITGFDYSEEAFENAKDAIEKNRIERKYYQSSMTWDRNFVFFFRIITTDGRSFVTALLNPFDIEKSENVLWFKEFDTKVRYVEGEETLYTSGASDKKKRK